MDTQTHKNYIVIKAGALITMQDYQQRRL